MNCLIAAAISTVFAQNPARIGEGPAWIDAAWSIGHHLKVPSQGANRLLETSALPVPVAVNPVSAVLALDQATIFIDPVGPQNQYRRFGRPDIVVLTRAHLSHLSIDTMIGLLRRDTVVLAPQTVIDQLPLMISNNVITPFESGMTQEVDGITFRALPTSAPIPFGTAVYQRDRGDIGVLLEVDGALLYF